MPVMDGYQVAELIRNRPKTKDMPIIFLTGAVNEEYTQFKEKYPDNVACVLKPIDIEAIKTHINHLMQ
jgi:CheY-like chemotaxis protein